MFLIGDKVTIKDDLNTFKYLLVNESMAKLAGREAIITNEALKSSELPTT